MSEPEVHVIDADRRKLFDWKELWLYKELFYFFTWRDIKVKYKQTTLGFLWAILQPLLMMLVLTFFFGRALDVPSQNIEYPVFVFSGLLLWNIFSAGLTNSANSMVNNSQIIKKIYFPRLIIPISAILVSLFDFMITLVLFVPLLLFFHQPVSSNSIWCWPFALILSIVSTLGPGCLLASLNVKYRDVRYIIPFLIQMLFFITPVIYPVSLIKYPVLQYIIILSPMYAAIELFRYPLTGIEPDLTRLMFSLTMAIILLVVGIVYFKRTEDFFADLA